MQNNNIEMAEAPEHRAGFISLVGKPNVGKSTLMNALVGENLSIITSKAQTTRHRIKGIINGDDFQIVYSDTPGIIEPKYELHKSMMSYVESSLKDADVILFVTDLYEKFNEEEVISKLNRYNVPIIVLVNKIDLAKTQEDVEEKIEYWSKVIDNAHSVFPISALENFNLDKVFNLILSLTPNHPPYYPKDELATRPERFFVSEIIREKIFNNYKKEIPYSCEVVVREFKEQDKIIHIMADILVERKSQKGILIGHQGNKLKTVGIQARKDLEDFFQKQIFLQTYVKVEDDWRKKSKKLDELGYGQ